MCFLSTSFVPFSKIVVAIGSPNLRIIKQDWRDYAIIGEAIALTFRPFLATFPIFHKWTKKQLKSKAIALTSRPFLATFLIFHKWPKNSKKVRL